MEHFIKFVFSLQKDRKAFIKNTAKTDPSLALSYFCVDLFLKNIKKAEKMVRKSIEENNFLDYLTLMDENLSICLSKVDDGLNLPSNGAFSEVKLGIYPSSLTRQNFKKLCGEEPLFYPTVIYIKFGCRAFVPKKCARFNTKGLID